MTVFLAVMAVALMIIAAIFSFAMGFYIGIGGKLTAKSKPEALPEPTEEQKRFNERYQRDLKAILTYTGTEQNDITGR